MNLELSKKANEFYWEIYEFNSQVVMFNNTCAIRKRKANEMENMLDDINVKKVKCMDQVHLLFSQNLELVLDEIRKEVCKCNPLLEEILDKLLDIIVKFHKMETESRRIQNNLHELRRLIIIFSKKFEHFPLANPATAQKLYEAEKNVCEAENIGNVFYKAVCVNKKKMLPLCSEAISILKYLTILWNSGKK